MVHDLLGRILQNSLRHRLQNSEETMRGKDLQISQNPISVYSYIQKYVLLAYFEKCNILNERNRDILKREFENTGLNNMVQMSLLE